MKLIVGFLLALPLFSQAALVDPALHSFAFREGGSVRVLALMQVPSNRPLPSRDPRAVRQYLRDITADAMSSVKNSVRPYMGRDIRVLSLHYVNLSFYAEVTPNGLKALANAPGVSKIYADRGIQNTNPVAASRPFGRRFTETVPYDLVQMELDKVWQQFPQVNGSGVMVGHIDTGVDAKHPALAGKVALFFDGKTGKIGEPHDEGEHGTHTAGTVVGDAHDGAPMGIAPGARLISAGALNGYDEMLKAMEFIMDPDSNPATNDAPRLVTNSWNCEGAPDVEMFYRAISAWEAAGILTVFSAGNSGPGGQTITKPHEHPLTLAVAATGADAKVASFSSRGPGIFNGQQTAKPDIAAPGVDIVSSLPNGRYAAMSGTSMAAPHIAGLAALMYQVAPGLTPQKARELIMQSANYVDPNGNPQQNMVWNASYGMGLASAFKVLSALKNMAGKAASQWGFFMNPVGEIMSGFQSMTSLETKSVGVAQELAMPYATNPTKWIDGASL